MSEYERQVEEGKQIVAEHVAALLPGVKLSWGEPTSEGYPLRATQGGRTTNVGSIRKDHLADVPGSYDDTTGDDDHWPRVRAFFDDAVALWKEQHQGG